LLVCEKSGLEPTVLLSGTFDDPAPLLGSFVQPGQTAALFGSSGVGKSTIVNALLREEAQTIGETVCQHTTTTRTLIRLPPGLRAVGVGGGVADAFADVAQLAALCRFSDCSHDGEPGCAVETAIAPERLASFRKLQKEAAYQHRREDGNAARAEKERWKQIHAAMKKMPKKGR
jgi:ribosome biogenesis GTPase